MRLSLRRALVAGLLLAGAALPATAQATGTPGADSSARGRVAGDTTYSTASLQLGPLRQNPRVGIVPGMLLGRDNAASVAAGGKSYWFFGDTFINAPLGAVKNSAAVTSDLNASDGIDVLSSNLRTEDPVGAPTEVLPMTAAEVAFEAKHRAASCAGSKDVFCGAAFAHWPGAAVYDAARQRIIVLTTKICRFGLRQCTTQFTGTVIGGGISTVDVRTGAVRRLPVRHQRHLWTPEGKDSTLLFDSADFFGGTAWGEGGYLYTAFGCEPYHFTCSLARVPLATVEDRAAWRFYAGQSRGKPVWTTSTDNLPRVLSTGAAGGTIQWVPAMKRYLAIYSVPYADDVVYQSAPAPWGPWTAAQRAFSTLEPQGEVNNYAAFAHPEYSPDGGLTQYVTYYHSGYGELQLVRLKFCPTGTALCI